MKIKLHAVERPSPSKEKHRAQKERFGSCRNADEKKAMKKADRFNKRNPGGAVH